MGAAVSRERAMTDLKFTLGLLDQCQRAYDQDPLTIEKNGVEVLIETTGGRLVVAPRGTQFNGPDIIRDLRVFVPMWHEGLGETARPVVVKAGKATKSVFSLGRSDD